MKKDISNYRPDINDLSTGSYCFYTNQSMNYLNKIKGSEYQNHHKPPG